MYIVVDWDMKPSGLAELKQGTMTTDAEGHTQNVSTRLHGVILHKKKFESFRFGQYLI